MDRTYDHYGICNAGVGIFIVKGNIRSNIGQSIRISRGNIESVQETPLPGEIFEYLENAHIYR